MSGAKSPSTPTGYRDDNAFDETGNLPLTEQHEEQRDEPPSQQLGCLQDGCMAAPGCLDANLHDENSNLWLRSIFFLLGVGILVPWNAFISAKAYFESRLCNDENGDHQYQASDNIESTFAVVYNISSVCSLGLLIFVQWFNDQRHAKDHESQHNSNNDNRSGGGEDMGHRRSSTATSLASSSSSSSASGHSFWLVMVPLTIYFLVFLGQAVVVLWIDLNPSLFFQYTIAGLALCGICGAIASAGITATAGLFVADIAMEPYLAGQSFGGLGVAVANFVAATTEDPKDFWDAHCSNNNGQDGRFLESTGDFMDGSLYHDHRALANCNPYSSADHAVLVYFLLGSLVLAACLFGYASIDRFQQSEHRDEYETIHDEDRPELGGQQEAGDSPTVAGIASAEQSPAGVEMMNKALLQQRRATDTLSNEDEEHQDQSVVALSSSMDELDFRAPNHHSPHRGMVDTHMSFGHDAVLDSHHEDENEMTEVLNIVKSPASSIFLVFVVTLSLFPGWISQLRSVRQCNSIHNRWANDLYTPFAFVWFNLFDFIGRLLSGYLPLAKMHHVSAKLVGAAFLRFALFPLLFICASHRDGDKWVLNSDLYSTTVQALFAVSNGFVVTTAFVHAPSLLPNVTHVQERSAEILTFALYVGLLTGSLLSVPVASSFAG